MVPGSHRSTATVRRWPGAVLAAAGGLISLAGAAVPWAVITVDTTVLGPLATPGLPTSGSIPASVAWPGIVGLVASALLVLSGIARLVAPAVTAWRTMTAVMGAAMLTAAVVGIFTAQADAVARATNALESAPGVAGLSDQIVAPLRDGVAAAISTTPGLGVALCAAGGIIGMSSTLIGGRRT